MKKFFLSCFAMLCMMFALAPPAMALQSQHMIAMQTTPAAGIDHLVVATAPANSATAKSFQVDGAPPSAAELAERMCTSPLLKNYVNLFPSAALFESMPTDPSVKEDPGIFRRMAMNR